MQMLESCYFAACASHGVSVFHQDYGCFFRERERLQGEADRLIDTIISRMESQLVPHIDAIVDRVNRLTDERADLANENVKLKQEMKYHLAHVVGLQERLRHLQREMPGIARKLVPVDDPLE